MPRASSRTKQQNVAGQATRARLLRVAERLIGRRGYDSVSIRDLTFAAGVDVSAIHYHFGSKHALAAAAFEQGLKQAAARRKPMLDALGDTDHPTVGDIARCLVAPAAQRTAARGRVAREREAFLSAVAEHPDFARQLTLAMENDIICYMAALQEALPEVSSGTLIRRLLFAISVVQRVLAHPFPQEHIWLRRYGAEGQASAAEDVIAFVTAALRGP